MFGLFKKLFGSKPVETVVEAPYKAEAPVAITTPAAEKAVEAVVKSIAKPAPKKKQYYAKKKPAAKTATLKPAVAKKPKAKPTV